MNADSLRAGLHDLAEQAQPADLRDRAVRTSHRIGRTRLALVAGATVLTVGVTFAGVTLDRRDRALPEIATTRTPAESPQASFPAGATAAVYLNDQSVTRLVSVWDATGLRHFSTNDFPTSGPDQSAVKQNATVSPDGAYLAWVFGSDVWIARVDGPLVGRFANPVEEGSSFDGNCMTPEFSADSTRLLVRPALGEYGWLTVPGLSYEPNGERSFGCQVRINGDWAAFLGSDQSFTEFVGVRNLRTGETRRIPGLPAGPTAVDVASVSPDGSRLTARISSEQPRDGYRSLAADVLLDTRTGRTVGVATGGLSVRQMFYLADGNLVVRAADGDRTHLLIFSSDGRLISDDIEAAELRNAMLLRLVTP